MSDLILSGQHVTMNVTALTSIGSLKTDEEDLASAFTFTSTAGEITYNWPLTIASWASGTNVFTLTAPTVDTRTTLTLNTAYKGNSLPISPSLIQFDVMPNYRGNFNLTGAVLAWDGTIYNIGTDRTLFDYSEHDHIGTAGDGESPIPSQWFTDTFSYTTTPGGPPITLGRNLASITYTNRIIGSDDHPNPYPGNMLLELSSANGLASLLDNIQGTTWAISILSLFIMNIVYSAVQEGSLINYTTFDSTNNQSLNISININTTNIEIYMNSNLEATISLNDSNHFLDPSINKALCISLTISEAEGSGTAIVYFNENPVASFATAYSTSAPSALNILQNMGSSTNSRGGGITANFAIADFAVFSTALTQEQIATQASAWGL